jgi:hypothetical protein
MGQRPQGKKGGQCLKFVDRFDIVVQWRSKPTVSWCGKGFSLAKHVQLQLREIGV